MTARCTSLNRRHLWTAAERSLAAAKEMWRRCRNCGVGQHGTSIPKVVRDQFLTNEAILEKAWKTYEEFGKRVKK